MARAVQNKIDSDAVPYREQEYANKYVAVDNKPDSTAATERKVDIMHDPVGKAHVPATPVFCNRMHAIGLIEVFWDFVA